MPDLAPAIDSTASAVDSIIEAARAAAPPEPLDLGYIYHRPRPDGGVDIIDLTTAEHLTRLDELAKHAGVAPERKTGVVNLTEHESLSKYVTEHAEQMASTLWADRDAGRITAVLNGHLAEDDSAGWGDHRAILTLRQTPAWRAWTAASGQLVDQQAFAEFLEDRAADVVEPDAATLIEVVTTIEATTGVAFKSAVRLQDGQTQLRYEETTDAKAGQAGQLTIPQRITLGIAPFEGIDPYRLTARLRYRLRDGRLTIGVVLDQPEDVLRAAFGDVIAAVETATDLTVMHGSPAR